MNHIEKYLIISKETLKQKIGTLNRWDKEHEYQIQSLKDDITFLQSRLQIKINELIQIKKYKKQLDKVKK